jgi:hypothetical protein
MGEQMKDDTLIHVNQTGGVVLPALITHAVEKAEWRFLEFFTVNIRNKNTRAAYGQAAGVFLRCCEERGITRIEDVQPMHVAGYVEQLQAVRSAPTVKQHLACIRMLFDWLVIGQVMPANPANSVRGRVIRSARVQRRCCPPRKQQPCSPAWIFQPSSACGIARWCR